MNRENKKKRLKSLCKLFGCLEADRRGSTLIEVVVSVLIVGIAFVPLMVGLHAALRINKSNENTLYAENVAENISEVCKTYGFNGLEKLCGGGSGESINAVFTGATLKPGDEGASYDFKIIGIKSGIDKEYSAEITFSTEAYDPVTSDSGEDPEETPTPGAPRQNDFSNSPSLSSISNACMINLEKNDLNNIVSYFYSLAIDTYGTEVGNLSIDDMKSGINQWLSRVITVKIEIPDEGPNEGSYLVSKQVEYFAKNVSLKDDGNYIFSNQVPDITIGSSYILFDTEENQKVAAYSSLPQNIILTYKPLKDSSDNPRALMAEKIVIDKQVNGIINLNCLCENGSALYGWPTTVFEAYGQTATESNDPDHENKAVRVYNNLFFSTYNCYGLDHFGDGVKGKQNRMKDVNIIVRDSEGNDVATKKATVIEFEEV